MRPVIASMIVLLLADSVRSDATSVDFLGINAVATGLNGFGTVIGQIEFARPGKPGFDAPQYVHDQVNPTQVYASTNTDFANSPFVMHDIDRDPDHALSVAGVMIGSGGALRGVAPMASLHAGAINSHTDESFAFVGNRIARLLEMRAINVSVGRNLGEFETADGNSYVSRFVDWSARVHDVLWVIGGDSEGRNVHTPQDNFNGITVADSQPLNGGIAGAYRQVSPNNILTFDAVGNRTTIDLMAPDTNLLLPVQNNMDTVDSGTSFAAPHVTGCRRFARPIR
jgi:subtilisin family serine protease